MSRPAVIHLLAIYQLAMSGLFAGCAGAGQSSASFTVGVTIIEPGSRAVHPAARPAVNLTWNAAAISVRKAGYLRPARLVAADGLYWFEAERGGRRYRIAVSVASGGIEKIAAR